VYSTRSTLYTGTRDGGVSIRCLATPDLRLPCMIILRRCRSVLGEEITAVATIVEGIRSHRDVLTGVKRISSQRPNRLHSVACKRVEVGPTLSRHQLSSILCSRTGMCNLKTRPYVLHLNKGGPTSVDGGARCLELLNRLFCLMHASQYTLGGRYGTLLATSVATIILSR